MLSYQLLIGTSPYGIVSRLIEPFIEHADLSQSSARLIQIEVQVLVTLVFQFLKIEHRVHKQY